MNKTNLNKLFHTTKAKISGNLDNLCPQMVVLCQKWTIVALLDFNGYRSAFNSFRVSAKQLIDFLELDLQTNEINQYNDCEIVVALKNRQAQLANVKWTTPRKDVFYNNLVSIQTQFQLNTNESNVLLFTCLLTKSPAEVLRSVL